MRVNAILSVLCLLVLLLAVSGCASKAPAEEGTVPGLVTEQTGDIQVIMPDELGEPTQAEAKPYTAEERETYFKIEAEFICDSMTKELAEQQKLEVIAKKYGMTVERMDEITEQLTRAVALKESGIAATKLCPEGFAPSIN